jgi:ferric iron reductase protein FhuF
VDRPNCSATVVEKGNTVDEPTISIWSRAWAFKLMVAPIRAPIRRLNLVIQVSTENYVTQSSVLTTAHKLAEHAVGDMTEV